MSCIFNKIVIASAKFCKLYIWLMLLSVCCFLCCLGKYIAITCLSFIWIHLCICSSITLLVSACCSRWNRGSLEHLFYMMQAFCHFAVSSALYSFIGICLKEDHFSETKSRPTKTAAGLIWFHGDLVWFWVLFCCWSLEVLWLLRASFSWTLWSVNDGFPDEQKKLKVKVEKMFSSLALLYWS